MNLFLISVSIPALLLSASYQFLYLSYEVACSLILLCIFFLPFSCTLTGVLPFYLPFILSDLFSRRCASS